MICLLLLAHKSHYYTDALPQQAIAVGALLFATDSIQALGAVLRMIGVINAVELGAVHLHRNL